MKMSGRTLALVLAMALLLPVTIVLAAQSGVEFALFWDTVDGGGGTSSGGGYTLSGTIGQPDAGAMSGGNYALTGGFWIFAGDGGTPPSTGSNLYLPVIMKR